MPTPSSPILTARALNRATLARQLLLEREKLPLLRAVERLVALQAQQARPPYVGLWSRVEGFRREDLTRLLHRRDLVRATLMRGTLHLASAKDYAAMRPAFSSMLESLAHAILRERAKGLDIAPLVAAAREYLAEEPHTFEEVRDHLLERHPKADERAMGFIVRMYLPLVQVPTEDAAWGFPATTDFALAESWLGAPPGTEAELDTLVLRYLAAFGPASVSDVQTWTGLKGLKDVLGPLRPKLLTFRDEKGRELFDLPKAPRPPEDTPAPVRFLPDFDSLILGHDDRARLVAEAHRSRLITRNLRIPATFLVDGFVTGTWKVARKKSTATLVVEPFEPLSRKTREALAAEGEGLLRFVEPDAAALDIRFS
ncbi:winged helix DNA-binding domain-containing protein [Pyxidicoccus fallax]|uniref:Winged helix DNA-binding domain-containing protein n=1 Tax=Pyxidicoccus fallax TaxID=394095 RepID=A0A848LU61_9BACT|nr:winged helix DNA-binding domain-containing protein [Pyxidicoccus fallax]NMO21160.1 winged helix DNA-binding domain-containing protein [Pyxidicoccus fallax]NPC82186.1 winged helix DNA-binding domain-containing protein [Pyxidicoccus fallax]